MKPALPTTGEPITRDQAMGLCLYFGLDHLVARVEERPGDFRTNWTFDGCSFTCPRVLAAITGSKKKHLTSHCCLPHDLAYAFGDRDNEAERREADRVFYDNLRKWTGMNRFCARIIYLLVRAFGKSRIFGSWGFGNVHTGKLGLFLRARIKLLRLM